jgi:hypothetical protein
VNRATLRLGAAALLFMAIAASLSGQDSQFGIAGLGTPGRPESVRSRSTAGAFAPFDPTSSLTEASLVEIGSLTANASLSTSNRDVVTPTSSTWLRTTRFPMFSIGGPLGSRRVFASGSFSSYLDRSYSVVTAGTMMLRGKTEPYIDETESDGGVGDLRLGMAFRLSRRLALGIGGHLLPGSTHETATRVFGDSISYAVVRQVAFVHYEALGISGSALLTLGPALSIIAYARSDGSLHTYVGDTLTNVSDLPVSVGGGLRWTPSAKARFAGSATWHSWSGSGSNSFDTINWSVGGEFGATNPVRFGVRGGQLPFGPGTAAPTEWGGSLGTGRGFARGRGFFDLGVEYLYRSGPGLNETVWTVLAGMTIRP